MKKCPFCAEEIQDEAIKCKHCGEWLGERPTDAPPVPTSFDVVLLSSGERKIQMIQQVRGLTGLGLKEAKDLVDGAPSVVMSGLSAEDAEAVRQRLLVVMDAAVEVRPTSAPLLAAFHVPKCPTCGSANVKRITGGQKAARVALIGVFAAPKAMKSYECLNCKARW